MKADKTIIGILGGVAIGAVLGILMAPDKGTNTRKKIIKKSNAAADDLKETLDKISNSLSEKYNSLISKQEDIIEKEKNNFQSLNK